jgi:cytochrome b561
MILTMLFVGIGMVASLSNYLWLILIHKPLGVLVLVLVAVRMVNRLLNPPPPLLEGMPGWLGGVLPYQPLGVFPHVLKSASV